MAWIHFFLQGLKNLATVGTVTRTSHFAAKEIASKINYQDMSCIVELGAGDGAITKYILQRMPAEAKLLAFELNPDFCNNLNALNDQRLIIIMDSAENLELHLLQYNIKQVDAIFSALPFAIIPDDITKRILHSCQNLLKPGGSFYQIHYTLKRIKLYESYFGPLKVERIWWNIPPLYFIRN